MGDTNHHTRGSGSPRGRNGVRLILHDAVGTLAAAEEFDRDEIPRDWTGDFDSTSEVPA